MAGLDIPFAAITIDTDESYPSNLKKGDIPYYISRAKARAYEAQLRDDQLLITADTIVWLKGHMLGKPHDEAEAIAMLKQLRNKTHQVYMLHSFYCWGSVGVILLSTLFFAAFGIEHWKWLACIWHPLYRQGRLGDHAVR